MIDKSVAVSVTELPSGTFQIAVTDSSMMSVSSFIMSSLIISHANLIHNIFPGFIEHPFTVTYKENGIDLNFLYEVDSLENLGQLKRYASHVEDDFKFFLPDIEMVTEDIQEELKALMNDISSKKNEITGVIQDFRHLNSVQYHLITKYKLEYSLMHVNGEQLLRVLKSHFDFTNKELLVSDNCVRTIEMIRDALCDPHMKMMA